MTFKLTLRDVAIEAAIADVLKENGKAYGTSTSEHLMQLARTFPDAAGFLAACSETEQFLSSEQGKATVDAAYKKEGIKLEFSGNVPKTWGQAKSNIKRALEAGLKLADHETESAMRKALIAKRAADKAEKNPASALDGILATLGKSIKMLPADKQEAAIKAVTVLATKYHDAAVKLMAAKKPVPAVPPVGKAGKVPAKERKVVPPKKEAQKDAA